MAKTNMSVNTETKRFDTKNILRDQRILLFIIIVGGALIVGAVNEKFWNPMNIVAIFQQIAVAGLLTMAMGMLLLLGGIDLSIGNIMILSGCVMSVLLTNGVKLAIALPVGILVSILCGLINGIIIAKSKCMPLIISLGMSGAYFGIALLITEGRFMSFKLAFEGLRTLKLFNIIPITLLIFIALVIVASIVVNRTKYGRRIVAIGGNEKNAYLSGINVDLYKILTYSLSGLYCGIAAILYASRLDSITAQGGSGYELTALTGAIIGGITFDGGKGTILGAFLGVVLMGILSNAMTILGVNTFVQEIVSGLIIVVAVVLSNIDAIRKK
ncbi:MAG: ABC transporter permease [Caldicoprobacterales bacterium]|jgi:ribose transport system permease protein